ncbi:hypothetical protein PLESTB_001251100 [Pleodorina starrii]|uniref:Uncharacterized protein n=1 Tax=Pleodorina starrii TaxID=330485 RepID=A0A9W6F6L9_9CHLO|nr:hypothetical protein PLESTB_001251100 [Pleodorina starrii]
MEFLLPHMDEFILDFDAEEAALLQAQMLVAGQLQAGIGTGPGLGAYPVRQVQSLPNAATKLRGRQQPQLGGGGAQAAEPVQLDSQLDALRREIARLEQQKQKQVAAKAAPAGTAAAAGTAAVRRPQKAGASAAAALPRPTGTAIAGAAASAQGGPAAGQRQLAAKRPRVASAPSLVGVPAASGSPPADAPRLGTAGVAGAAQLPPEPTISVALPASSGQLPAATDGAAAPAQQRVGSKRPADEGTGGPATQQPRPQPKRQPLQRRPQQLEQPSVEPQPQPLPAAREPGLGAAGATTAERAVPRGAEPPLQPVPQAADAPGSSGAPGGQRQNDGDTGAGREPGTGVPGGAAAQQGPGSIPSPGFQKLPSQAGPGPPRKRPRAPCQRPAASTSGPTAASVGGSPGSYAAAAAAAGLAAAQPTAAANGVAGAQTASNSSASTQDGGPTAMLGQGSKRARPEVAGAGPGAAPAGLAADAVDEGGAGSGDDGLDAGGAGGLAGGAHGRSVAPEVSAAQISPEAEQAATAFLMSFMTQINGGDGQDPDRVAATAAAQQAQGAAPQPLMQTIASAQPQQQQHVRKQNSPQQQQQQWMPPTAPQEDQAPSARAVELPPGANAGVLGRQGDGRTERGSLAVGGRGMLSPGGGGGGALARRAAAERTSAAVQRLRRKSSGVSGADPPLRTATSAGAAGAAAPATSADASTGAAAGAAAGGAGSGPRATATSPVRTGGVAGAATLPEPHVGRQSRRRRGGASAPQPAPSGQSPAVCAHPQQPGTTPHGVAAGVGDGTPAPATLGGSPARPLATAGLRMGAAATPHATPHARGPLEAPETAPSTAEVQEPLGAVSSPVAPPGVGYTGDGLQAGASAHVPPWVQAAAGGWGQAADRAQTGPGEAQQRRAGEQMPQLRSLDRTGFGSTGGAPLGTAPGSAPGASAGSAQGPAPAAAAGASQPQPQPLPNAPHPTAPTAVPFWPGAPFGALPPFGLQQLPFPQPPPPGLPSHLMMMMMSGGPFPGAFPPGPPPPGMQWRSGPHGGAPLGAAQPLPPPQQPQQPVVSLVEVDVLARKELILLKWSMLQEMASELEAEWVEACHAHNRLRQLSMASAAQPGRAAAPAAAAVAVVAASTPAGDPTGNAEAAATQGGVSRRAEGASPALSLQLMAHQHPPPQPLGQQQPHPQPQSQPEQQPHLQLTLQSPPQLQLQLQPHQQSEQQPQQQEQEQEQQQQNQQGNGVAASVASQPPLSQRAVPQPPATQVKGSAAAVQAAAHATGGLQSAQDMVPGAQGGLGHSSAARQLGLSDGAGPSGPADSHFRPGTEEEPRPGAQPALPQHQHLHHSCQEQHAGGAPVAFAQGNGAGSEQGPRQEQQLESEVPGVPTTRLMQSGDTALELRQQEAAASGAAAAAPDAGPGVTCAWQPEGGPQGWPDGGAAGLALPRSSGRHSAAPGDEAQGEDVGAAEAAGAPAEAAGAEAPAVIDARSELRARDQTAGAGAANVNAGSGRSTDGDGLGLLQTGGHQEALHVEQRQQQQQEHLQPAGRADKGPDGRTGAIACAGAGAELAAGLAPGATAHQGGLGSQQTGRAPQIPGTATAWMPVCSFLDAAFRLLKGCPAW